MGVGAYAAEKSQVKVWKQERADAARAFDKRDYVTAEKHLKAALDAAGSFEPTDARLSQTLADLAKFYHDLRRDDLAVPLLERVLALRVQAHGSNHLEVAYALAQVGDAYIGVGKLHEAEQAFLTAGPIVRRTYGRSHPITAEISDALGRVYLSERAYEKAADQFKEAVELAENPIGFTRVEDWQVTPLRRFADEGQLCELLNNYGVCLTQLGKLDEAEKALKRSAAMVERNSSKSSARPAIPLRNLAFIEGKRKNLSAQESLLERALSIQQHALGPKHPDTMETVGELIFLHLQQKDYVKAEALQLQFAPGRSEPRQRPLIETVATALGDRYVAAKRYPEAESLYERAIAMTDQKSGSNDVTAARFLLRLGDVLAAQQKNASAESAYLRCLALQERHLGPDHLALASTLRSTASLLAQTGRYDEARNFYDRTTSIMERAFGPNDSRVADCLDDSAVVLRKLQRAAEADSLQARANKIRTSVR